MQRQVYSLHTASWKWTEHTAEVQGEPPSVQSASGHTASALPDGRHLLVFGGGSVTDNTFTSAVTLLDTHTWRWFAPGLQVSLVC